MQRMHENYARDLDLNLLRAFVVVADAGSVTQAAARLYLTQPAVSAALRRLTRAVGAPLFVRQGRGVALSARGERLLAAARPHLQALVDAALAPPRFDPATSDRTIRLGLSDISEGWLLPELLRALAARAPRMQIICVPVQFRTVVGALLARAVDIAFTVADDVPPSIRREHALHTGFTLLYDPRHRRLPRVPTDAAYFAAEHVIVSYAADLRGVVEDVTGRQRGVRCSLSTFSHLGDVLDGSALVATVPMVVARTIRRTRPHLRLAPLPPSLAAIDGGPDDGVDLLWPAALDDDDACRFVRAEILKIARAQ